MVFLYKTVVSVGRRYESSIPFCSIPCKCDSIVLASTHVTLHVFSLEYTVFGVPYSFLVLGRSSFISFMYTQSGSVDALFKVIFSPVSHPSRVTSCHMFFYYTVVPLPHGLVDCELARRGSTKRAGMLAQSSGYTPPRLANMGYTTRERDSAHD